MKNILSKKTIPIYIMVLLLLTGVMLFTRKDSISKSTNGNEEQTQSSSYALNQENMEETYKNSQEILKFELGPADAIRLHFDSAISAAYLNKDDAATRAQIALDYINGTENAEDVVTYTDLSAAIASLELITSGKNEEAVNKFPPYNDIQQAGESEDVSSPATEQPETEKSQQ
jgi:hypothetical protein